MGSSLRHRVKNYSLVPLNDLEAKGYGVKALIIFKQQALKGVIRSAGQQSQELHFT